MTYEVEERARIKDKEEHERVRKILKKTYKEKKKRTYTAYLFRKPHYLRLKYVGKYENAKLEVKKGTYADGGRLELAVDIKKKDVPTIIRMLPLLGYKEHAHLKIVREKFVNKDFEVIIKSDKYMGTILEAEKIVKDKKQIKKANEDVKKEIKRLGLKLMQWKEYKAVIDNQFKKSRKTLK